MIRLDQRFSRFTAGAFLSALAAALVAPGAARGADEKALKVVVHVNFPDAARQGDGLKNVANILKAAAAAGVTTEIEVVCHSGGITLLEKAETTHAAQVEALQKQGVRFAACENTMRQRSLKLADLVSGTATVPSGAFEVVLKQRAGYSYFKP